MGAGGRTEGHGKAEGENAQELSMIIKTCINSYICGAKII